MLDLERKGANELQKTLKESKAKLLGTGCPPGSDHIPAQEPNRSVRKTRCQVLREEGRNANATEQESQVKASKRQEGSGVTRNGPGERDPAAGSLTDPGPPPRLRCRRGGGKGFRRGPLPRFNPLMSLPFHFSLSPHLCRLK